MSAVSAESPRGSADLSTSVSSPQAADERASNGVPAAQADFGPNQWLVDELYQRYQADPGSVDQAWWSFFADYHPLPDSASTPTADRTSPAPAPPAAATAPAPAPLVDGQSATAATRTTAEPTTGSDGQRGPAAPAQPQAPGTAAVAGSGLAAAGTVAPSAARTTPAADAAEHVVRLRGAAARTAANMTASLTVPTATSVRPVPAKLLIDNRIVINNHLARGRGGKISFTHLIGYALVRALATVPEMNFSYAEVDGKPVLVEPEHVNLGLAIDVRKDDGSRQLLVPSIKNAETLDFRQFWLAYEDIIRKARTGKLAVDDFAGTTISLTNPGTIGTEHSVPRLVAGQGCIVGVGAMEYPAAYRGASAETIARQAISKTVDADLDL